MKSALAVMLFAASAFAQKSPFPLAPSCGPRNATFRVTLDESQHTLEPAPPGKARIYFIQDNGLGGEWQTYTLKIGVDGSWVGAYKDNSWFTISVAPGEHHLCANVQSKDTPGSLVALAHFTAKAGGVYYFRTRSFSMTNSREPTLAGIELAPLDSDQAKYSIAFYPLSVSQVKK